MVDCHDIGSSEQCNAVTLNHQFITFDMIESFMHSDCQELIKMALELVGPI